MANLLSRGAVEGFTLNKSLLENAVVQVSSRTEPRARRARAHRVATCAPPRTHAPPATHGHARGAARVAQARATSERATAGPLGPSLTNRPRPLAPPPPPRTAPAQIVNITHVTSNGPTGTVTRARMMISDGSHVMQVAALGGLSEVRACVGRGRRGARRRARGCAAECAAERGCVGAGRRRAGAERAE